MRLQLPENMNQSVATKILKKKWEKSDISVLVEKSVDNTDGDK